MAKYKNITGARVDARFLNRFLDPDEIVEIPDEIARQYAFSPEVWKEITPPKGRAAKKRAPRKKAAAKKVAAPTPSPEPAGDTPAAGDATKTEEV